MFNVWYRYRYLYLLPCFGDFVSFFFFYFRFSIVLGGCGRCVIFCFFFIYLYLFTAALCLGCCLKTTPDPVSCCAWLDQECLVRSSSDFLKQTITGSFLKLDPDTVCFSFKKSYLDQVKFGLDPQSCGSVRAAIYITLSLMKSAILLCPVCCRVWDISGLRKKSVAPGPGGLDDHLKNPGSTDLFGQVPYRYR